MRSAVFVAILVSASALLAGCSDKKDSEEHTYTCPDGSVLDLEQFPDHENATFNPLSKCPKTGSSTNSTSLAPNVLPTLVLTVKDDAGNVTPVTLLDGNLTFSAEGSTDSDGQITGIAVSVTDSNTTRTATLYDAAAKTFKSATFKFDRPGVVNVTVAMVDDRAGFTVNQTKVYVNHPQTIQAQTIQAPDGGLTTRCQGSPLGPIADAVYTKSYSFTVFAGATFAEATGTGDKGAPVLTFCTPDSDPSSEGCQCEAISEDGNPIITNAPMPEPQGIQTYSVYATTESANNIVSVFVVVHYEPQAAAPAA